MSVRDFCMGLKQGNNTIEYYRIPWSSQSLIDLDVTFSRSAWQMPSVQKTWTSARSKGARKCGLYNKLNFIKWGALQWASHRSNTWSTVFHRAVRTACCQLFATGWKISSNAAIDLPAAVICSVLLVSTFSHAYNRWHIRTAWTKQTHQWMRHRINSPNTLLP